jgi:hypothetical protein
VVVQPREGNVMKYVVVIIDEYSVFVVPLMRYDDA